MTSLIKRLIHAANRYTVWDFGYLKIAMLALGILLGTYLSHFFIDWIAVVWIVFAVTYLLIVIKTFNYLRRNKE